MMGAKTPAPHLGWFSRGYLPHWDQPGMIQSLNFRLADSMPAQVVDKWRMELRLEPDRERAIELRRRVEDYLDAGHGECLLRRPEIARKVEEALLHFDPERYRLLAWCVMPNHVHALIETKLGFPMVDVLHAWKSFLAHKINKLLGRQGELWQREYHDRFVRNAEHYEKVVAYIEENPVKAKLVRIKSEWPYCSARFRKAGNEP
jgi:REP element-mobilizing transposase RayT